MPLNEHENTVKELIDSFRKMCDFIEQTDEIGCGKCPVFNACFYKDKHKGLKALMNELNIES